MGYIFFIYLKKLLRNRDDDDDGNGDHPKLAEEYYCAGVTPRFLYFFLLNFVCNMNNTGSEWQAAQALRRRLVESVAKG